MSVGKYPRSKEMMKEMIRKRTENRRKNGWWKDKEAHSKHQSKVMKLLYKQGKVKNDWKYMIGNKNGKKLKGIKRTPEFCKALRKANLGKKASKKTKEKLSKSMKEQFKSGKRRIIKFNTIKTGEYKKKQIKGIDKPISHWAWKEYYGRFPKRGMIIHHKDGNENNNEISNLEIMTKSQHIKLHWSLSK